MVSGWSRADAKNAMLAYELTSSVVGEHDSGKAILSGQHGVFPTLHSLEDDGHPVERKRLATRQREAAA